MISRCPSCGAQVEEEATRCPSCHWDFIALKRLPPEPEGGGFKHLPPVPPPSKEKAPPPAAPPQPEGAGLAQFPKLDPAQKRQAPESPSSPPMALPQFDSKPPLPEAPSQSSPSGAKPPQPPAGAPRKPAPGPASEPFPAPAPRAPAEPSRAQADAAERFRRKSATLPAARLEPERWPLWQSLIVIGSAVAVLSMGVIYFLLRSEVPVASRGPDPSLFSDQPEADQAPSPVQAPSAEPTRPGPAPASLAAGTTTVGSAPPAVSPSTAVQALASPAPAPTPSAPKAAAVLAPASLSTTTAALVRESVPREPPKPKAGPLWVFEGRVYDLISLHPVFAAKIEFKEPSGTARAEASTDGEGGYRVVLPALGGVGYHISVKHPDYLEKYLDEISPPFREVDKGQRSFLAQSASSNKPWTGRPSAVTKRDFVLIPRQALP